VRKGGTIEEYNYLQYGSLNFKDLPPGVTLYSIMSCEMTRGAFTNSRIKTEEFIVFSKNGQDLLMFVYPPDQEELYRGLSVSAGQALQLLDGKYFSSTDSRGMYKDYQFGIHNQQSDRRPQVLEDLITDSYGRIIYLTG
jgi:hypothetical protein